MFQRGNAIRSSRSSGVSEWAFDTKYFVSPVAGLCATISQPASQPVGPFAVAHEMDLCGPHVPHLIG